LLVQILAGQTYIELTYVKQSACLDGIINFDSAILYDTNFIGANINTKLVSFKGAKINKSATGLPRDSLCAHNNKYVNDIKNFSEAIERRFKSLNIEVEQIKYIEETVNELVNEVQDIDDNNVERLTGTKKQGIETKLIALVEKIAYVLPEINLQTDDVFESLNSFKSLIPGGVKQLIQSIIIRNEKKGIEVSKMHYIEEAGKFRRLGKFEQAIQCYDEALNLEPDDFAILYYKGLALFDLSNYDEAIQYFDRSLKVNPKYNDTARYKELACDKIRKRTTTTLSEKDQGLNKLMKEIFFPITQTSLGRRINIR
jgi:tetratricopeptide (TPR) repeat protein